MAKFGFDERRLFNISDLSLEKVSSAPTLLSGETAVYAKSDDLLYFNAFGASEQLIAVGGINVGSPTANPDGADVFKQYNTATAQLEFRRLVSSQGTVNFTTSATEVDINVDLSDINDELDHGQLLGLADDDHLQYLLLAGRSGGQTAYGGTGSGDSLRLYSTAHATKGSVIIDDGSKFQFGQRVEIDATLQTANDTFTSVSGTSVTLSDNVVYSYEATIIGRRSSGGEDRAMYILQGLFYRAGGAAVQQGSTHQAFKAESDGAWDAQIITSSNNVLVQVKGEPADTVEWRVQIKYMAIASA